MRFEKKRMKKFNILYVIILIITIGFLGKDIVNYAIINIEEFLFPIQSKIYFLGKKAKENTKKVINYKDLIVENDKLKHLIVQKSLVEKENQKLLNENDRLRQLLELKGRFKFKFKVAKINFQQTREMYESFAINLGRIDGIKENMPVLNNNYLIGKIESVYDNYSIVQMITYQNSVVSASVNKDIIGVVKGDRGDELVFEPVSFYEAKLNIGDKVFTSGISDIYPKNIYIGDIYKMVKKYGDTMEYFIKLPFNINDVYEVIVLTEVER